MFKFNGRKGYKKTFEAAEETYQEGIETLFRIEEHCLEILDAETLESAKESARYLLQHDLTSPEGLVQDTFAGMRDLAIALAAHAEELEEHIKELEKQTRRLEKGE